MSTPRQEFDHAIDVLQGWVPGTKVLNRQAVLSAEVSIIAYAGRVVRIDTSGEFQMGANGTEIPLILTGSSDEPDVDRVDDLANGMQGISRKRLSGLIMVAGREIQTTEYDTAQTYAVNEPLRAQRNNSVQATAGALTNAGVTVYTNNVVGFVTGGTKTNRNRKSVLEFITHFLPGTAGN